jgi:predicted acyltransferase (DUF342 family)
MMVVWAPLALTSLTGVMLALPLTPALLEVRRRADAAPIPIQQHDGEIANFARSFRRYIEPLLTELEACGNASVIAESTRPDGRGALLVGQSPFARQFEGTSNDPLVLFAARTVLTDDLIFGGDVYAADTLFAGKREIFRALLAEKDIFLGEGSQVLRWMHAEDSAYLERHCQSFGRLSAGHAIYMWPGCTFERVHAPRIATVWDESGFPLARTDVGSPGSRLDRPLRRWRVAGDFTLRSGEELQGNLVAASTVRLGDGCRVVGSIKSHGDTLVGAECEIDGSVVSTACVRIAGDSFVRGPVLAEEEVVVGPGAQIGAPDMLTTISAPRIRIAPGSLVHGTLWPREKGSVEV